jgi:hypothetical protein
MATIQPHSPELAGGSHAKGLVLAVPFANRTARDYSGAGLAPSFTGNVVWNTGPRGTVLSHLEAIARTNYAVLSNLSLTAATVVFGMRKRDGTARVSCAFGVPVAGGTAAWGALVPYSDGVVYWDWGGTGVGVTRLSVAGLTFGDDVWVFSTGSRGMEIWQNGVRRASNAATPSRSSNTGIFGLGNYTGGSDFFDVNGLLIYGRQLTVEAIRDLSGDPWLPFRRPQAPSLIRVVASLPTAGPATYTASGTLSSPSPTLSGTATFVVPTYAATGALSSPSPTLSGTATHVTPVYTASGALASPSPTLAGTATHTTPVYTITGVLASPSPTLSGSATTATLHQATGALSSPSPTLAGTATATGPTYTATGALTSPSPTLSGTATHVTPVYTITGALASPSPTLAGTAVHATAVYQASGTLASPSPTLVGTATHTTPTYSASGTLSSPSPTLVGTAAVVNPAYTAAGALSSPSPSLSGTATFTDVATYAAVGTLASPSPILAGSATFTPGAGPSGGGVFFFRTFILRKAS